MHTEDAPIKRQLDKVVTAAQPTESRPAAREARIAHAPSVGRSFLSDVATLVGGTAVAQALALAIAPIVARLYAPDAFGTATLFASLVSIVGVVACLRYELAIMLPESEEEAVNLLAVSAVSAIGTAAISAFVILFAGEWLVRLFNAQGLRPYLWLVPVAVLLQGILLALKCWSTRGKHFGRVSAAGVLQSGGTNAGQLALGAAGQAHAGALIGSRVFGAALAAVVLGAQSWRNDRDLGRRRPSRLGMLAGARLHRKFPLFDTWASLLNTASATLPAFLLAAFFSMTVVGHYGLGMRAVYFPMTLVGAGIAQVFFQRSAEARTRGELAPTVRNVFEFLVSAAIVPLLVLTIAGRDLFSVVFGGRWAEAGSYAQILSPWMFALFTSSPMSILLRVLERQQTALYLNCIIFASRLVSMVVGGYLHSVGMALALWSASGVLIYGWYTLFILELAGVDRRWALSVLSRQALYATPALAALVALRVLGVSPAVVTAACGLIVVTYEVAFLAKSREVAELLQRLRERRRAPGGPDVTGG